MKEIKAFVVLLLATIVISCSGSTPSAPNKSTITGKALYYQKSSSDGIAITAELIESGKSKGIVSQTVTAVDGSYAISDLDAGTYTVYASSDSTKEKAIATNVSVSSGASVSASTLYLTPTGSITGKIAIDEKSSGISGYTIFIPGTSYSAITADDGSFTISDVPVSSYILMIMYGEKSVYLTVATVTPSATYSVGTLKVTSSSIGIENTYLNWKGILYSSPSNPEEGWMYFNMLDGKVYIYLDGVWYFAGSNSSIIWIGSYSSPDAISSPSDNWAYYNTTDGITYIYSNGEWAVLANGGKSINWIGSYSSTPSSASLYDAYYNTSDGCSYIYDGTRWTLLASKGSKGDKGDTGLKGLDGTSISWQGAFNTPPENPQELWCYFDILSGCSFIYHNGTWNLLATAGISISWLGSFDAAPSGPFLYNAYFNNLDGCSYIYDGEKWTLLAAKGDAGHDGDKGESGKDGADGKSIIWKGSYAFKEDLENPEELWAFYNTSDGCSYIYTNGEWTLLASSSSMDSERTMITGYVSAEERESKAGIYVTATSIANTSLIYKTYTNSDGYFAFSSFAEGEYLISITADGYISSTPDTIKVESGKVSDLGTIELKLEKGTITGKVTLDATSDYSGVVVKLLGTDYEATTDTSGFYTFKVIPGTYSGGISFEKKNYKAVSLATSVVVKKDCAINIEDVALNATNVDYVTGTVKINGLSDNSGIVIKLTNSSEIYSTTTNSSGFWSIGNVLLGNYTLVATKAGASEFRESIVIDAHRTINTGTYSYNLIIVSNPTFSHGDGTYSNDVSLVISADNDAVIYYTTDGTTPSASSQKYSGAIDIAKTTTVKAVAIKSKLSSEIMTGMYILKTGSVSASVAADCYSEAKEIALTSSSGDAEIYYTLNGSTPTKKSTRYTSPIMLKENKTLKAVAYKGNYDASDIFEGVYTFIKPSTPSLSLQSGTYDEGESIEIKSSAGAVIYYTTDGSTPKETSKEYSSEIALSSNMTVKAIAYRGGLSSDIVTATYKVKAGFPVASVKAGTYKNTQTVTLATDSVGATIYYTTNGKAPSTTSTKYTGPIEISKNTTIKAIAVKTGLLTSDTAEYSYVIDNQSGNISITDPDYREFSIKAPDGWSSGIPVNKGVNEKLEAILTPSDINTEYSWYIDETLVSKAQYIYLGSYLDYLDVGNHIIRAEASINGDFYADNFLLKVTK